MKCFVDLNYETGVVTVYLDGQVTYTTPQLDRIAVNSNKPIEGIGIDGYWLINRPSETE